MDKWKTSVRPNFNSEHPFPHPIITEGLSPPCTPALFTLVTLSSLLPSLLMATHPFNRHLDEWSQARNVKHYILLRWISLFTLLLSSTPLFHSLFHSDLATWLQRNPLPPVTCPGLFRWVAMRQGLPWTPSGGNRGRCDRKTLQASCILV